MQYETECLNRILNKCNKCIKDYNGRHHPNNLDCPNYSPIELLIIEIKEKENKEKNEI